MGKNGAGKACTVEVGVALEDVEKHGAGEESGPASLHHLVGVDIEELRIEVEAPKETLA